MCFFREDHKLMTFITIVVIYTLFVKERRIIGTGHVLYHCLLKKGGLEQVMYYTTVS